MAYRKPKTRTVVENPIVETSQEVEESVGTSEAVLPHVEPEPEPLEAASEAPPVESKRYQKPVTPLSKIRNKGAFSKQIRNTPKFPLR